MTQGHDAIQIDICSYSIDSGNLSVGLSRQMFDQQDMTHWHELVKRRAPKAGLPYILVHSDGWPLELTSFERILGYVLEVQYFPGDSV